MGVHDLSLLSACLLVWIAIVHLLMALGLRRGELVWSGRHPRLLDVESRWRSAFYALFLVVAALALATFGDVIQVVTVPARWYRSIGFTVMALLGVATIYSFGWGSRWERLLFGPMTLLGAIMAGYLTFA